MSLLDDIAGSPLTAEEVDGLDDARGPVFDLALPASVDERRLLDALYDDLERGEHAAAVLAEAEARRIAEYHRAVGPIPTVEGLGQLVLRVPLDVYLHWHAREGVEFWSQEENVDYIASRNPGLRPETQRRPVFTMPGLPGRDTSLQGSSVAECRSHKPEAAGSTPAPAPTHRVTGRGRWAA